VPKKNQFSISREEGVPPVERGFEVIIKEKEGREVSFPFFVYKERKKNKGGRGTEFCPGGKTGGTQKDCLVVFMGGKGGEKGGEGTFKLLRGIWGRGEGRGRRLSSVNPLRGGAIVCF